MVVTWREPNCACKLYQNFQHYQFFCFRSCHCNCLSAEAVVSYYLLRVSTLFIRLMDSIIIISPWFYQLMQIESFLDRYKYLTQCFMRHVGRHISLSSLGRKVIYSWYTYQCCHWHTWTGRGWLSSILSFSSFIIQLSKRHTYLVPMHISCAYASFEPTIGGRMILCIASAGDCIFVFTQTIDSPMLLVVSSRFVYFTLPHLIHTW